MKHFTTSAAAILFALFPFLQAADAKSPPTGLPTAEPRAVGMDAAVLAQIAPRMERFVADGKTAGVVTLVAKQGRVVHLEAVGHSNIEKKTPMRTDSLFCIASMTKSFTATALMVLVDEGKVGLDDPVSKYIPEFADARLKDGTSPSKPVTLRQLMSHTSGVVGNQQNEGTLAETAVALAKRPLEFEPGSRWLYGPGLSVCGRVVEVVSGQPFERFLDERVLKPLGTRDTTFHPNAEQQSRLAQLYEPGKEPESLKPATSWVIDLRPGVSPNPSGSLYSTAPDLVRFYQAIASGGQLDGRRILSEKAVEQMIEPQTQGMESGPVDEWGLGWCIGRLTGDPARPLPADAFGHGGAFGTEGWVDPVRQLVLVFLIQRTGFLDDGPAICSAFHEMAVTAVAK
jgi:CubicO group peptidase (beta-lactamase class C family)